MSEERLIADTVVKDARLSACGKYRYTLDRHWGDGPVAWWVMLNPSTADATVDDPTIRRCISFSKREGCGSLRVINLYALRATDPNELAQFPYLTQDEGRINASLLVEASYAARAGALVVVAWGAHPMAVKGARSVERMFQAAGAQCLGITKKGQPKHPLYVKGDQPLVAWRWGTHIDGSKRPPELSPEERKKRADQRDQGVLNDSDPAGRLLPGGEEGDCRGLAN